MRAFITTLFSVLTIFNATAQLEFKSGPSRVPLVELFTSEGCSSCPPADSWLGELRNDPDLWAKFVPIAFHVDYWDHLGWKDPFAKPSFSARQWAYGRIWDATIYTPEVIVGGSEKRNWRSSPSPRESSNSSLGDLTAIVGKNHEVNIQFDPQFEADSTLIVRVAVLGFDRSSSINRGENQGRNLKHNFVAISYQSAKLIPTKDGYYEARVELTPPPKDQKKLALAVWVEGRGDPRPLQATGGWLNNPKPAKESSSPQE